MKRTKKILIFAVCIMFLCACQTDTTATEPTTEPATAPSATELATEVTATEPVVTEPPKTESTIPALEIEPGDYLLTFTDENTGDYLDYYLFIPENAVEGMPLIVFLHGDGEVGKIDSLRDYGMIGQAKDVYGEEFPFIAISPCTRVTSWISGTIPQTLKALIDATVSTYSIDKEHIILTGHSRGSIGTWYMLSEYGDFFSAAVPVSCGSDSVLNIENCAEVPIWAFVGNGDVYENKYEWAMRSIIQRILDCGGQAEITILNGATHGDTSTEPYTLETFQWMLEQ